VTLDGDRSVEVDGIAIIMFTLRMLALSESRKACLPKDMMPAVAGGIVNLASVLLGSLLLLPKAVFFRVRIIPLSKPDRLMHYDLEVSGFPSSRSGHVILLD